MIDFSFGAERKILPRRTSLSGATATVAIVGNALYLARVPREQPSKRGLHFGEKLAAWMRGDPAAGRPPVSERELASAVGTTQATINYTVRNGSPKVDLALRIARRMRMSLDYLADPQQPYPPQADERLDVLMGSLTPSERDALAATVSVPGVLELVTRRRAPAPVRRSPPS
jgi:hypothetical protein